MGESAARALISHFKSGIHLMRRIWVGERATLIGVRGVWFDCGIVLILVWGTFIWIMLREAKQVEYHEETQVTLEARGLAEYVSLNLFLIERLLAHGSESYRATGALPTHESFAAELGKKAPLLTQISVANETGKLVASTLTPFDSNISIADRSHFRAFAGDPTDRLYFSQLVVGRISGKLSLQVARPVLSATGEFRGVIVASIDPLVLGRHVSTLETFGGRGMVTLVGRDDGIVRVRYAPNSISSGESVLSSPVWNLAASNVSGVQRSTSVLDGLERVIAFHQVGSYPLVVTVSMPAESLWDLTQGPLYLAFVMALAFSLALLLLTRVRVALEVEQEENVARLRASRNRELEANQMKSNFLASVSHELRTPLNSILGFSELIRDNASGPNTSKFAGLIHNSGKHLHTLVNTLLDLAKIEAGRMDVELEDLDVRELLTTLADTHRVSADKKGLALSLTLPAGGKIMANSDKTKLVEVLNNILHNAIKFTRSGKISVEGSFLGEGFLIRVTDSGPGIAEKDLTRVFERFNTVADEANPDKGSGLGLALSKNLMELLGGSITLQSKAGAGTRVDIFLPKVASES